MSHTPVTPSTVQLATTITQLRSSFQSHPFHITLESPWPILTSGAVLSMLTSAAMWFNSLDHTNILLILGFASTVSAMTLWWADVVKEGVHMGHHTKVVATCHSLGVSLFIVTELMVFISVFWAFLHSSLAPTVELGTQWPPAGVTALSPLTIPLLNTVLLVSSGATVTYAHHALFKKDRSAAIQGLFYTIVLASVFTALQGFEYAEAPFSWHDGAFGTCFFSSTGQDNNSSV